MQRRRGSNVCELQFSAFCQANSSDSECDIRGIEARRSAYRGHNINNFSHLVRLNSRRENRVDLIALPEKIIKKER